MKKLFCILLAVLASLSLPSCKNNVPSDTAMGTDTQAKCEQTESYGSAVVETESSEAETEAADIVTDAVTEPLETTDTYESQLIFEADEYDDEWIVAPLDKKISASDENWLLSSKSTKLYYDGYIGSDAHGSGFSLLNKNYISDSALYKFEFELYTPPTDDEKDMPNDKTLFVGLRQQMEYSGIYENDGIWLSFKDDSMCIKGSGETLNDALLQLPLPFGFEKGFRKVFIEDDQKQNTIRVYIGNDSGEKQLAYKLAVSKNADKGVSRITAYSWLDSFNNACAEAECEVELFKGGYVMLTANGRSEIYVKNTAFKIN